MRRNVGTQTSRFAPVDFLVLVNGMLHGKLDGWFLTEPEEIVEHEKRRKIRDDAEAVVTKEQRRVEVAARAARKRRVGRPSIPRAEKIMRLKGPARKGKRKGRKKMNY